MAKDLSRINSDEEIEKRDVDLSGFEYVTKGYFPHTFDPAINIRPDRIYFNAAIIKKLPDVFYVQLLINPKEKTLIIKPCNEDDKERVITRKEAARISSCSLFAIPPLHYGRGRGGSFTIHYPRY